MKTNRLLGMVTLFFLLTGWMAQAQDQAEVPGDNFSLEGALELFKKSASPEEFEKSLNNPDTKVNNLDLNGDGYIDYIRVFDRSEGNVHMFILQAIISEKESQDVAVISLEKQADGKAVLQITGDEDIYGVETILEPTKEVRTYAGTTATRTVVNVWPWPIVQYVYGPYYDPWWSPWGWAYRPYWWSPWRPVVYYSYYSYWRPYRPYYSVCYSHRIYYGYRPYRTTSVIVYNQHHRQVEHYRSAYISRGGRDRYDGGHSKGQIDRGSRGGVYDSNGRLNSTSGRTVDRSDSWARTGERSNERTNYRTGAISRDDATTRPTERTNYRTGAIKRDDAVSSSRPSRDFSPSSAVTAERNTSSGRVPGNERWTGSDNRNIVTQKYERTPVRTERSTSTSSYRQADRGSVSTPNSFRTIERTPSTNSQRSFSSPNVRSAPQQRSSGSFQRSSGSSSIQRSLGGGGSSVQRSSTPSRSSGGSVSRGIQRSSSSGGSRSSSGHRGRD